MEYYLPRSSTRQIAPRHQGRGSPINGLITQIKTKPRGEICKQPSRVYIFLISLTTWVFHTYNFNNRFRTQDPTTHTIRHTMCSFLPSGFNLGIQSGRQCAADLTDGAIFFGCWVFLGLSKACYKAAKSRAICGLDAVLLDSLTVRLQRCITKWQE